MEIAVVQDPAAPHRGRVTIAGRTYPCALGRAGISAAKREGDGATPAGRFALRRVLYRPDRAGPVVSGLPTAVIERNDGWCDDPASADYNRAVRLPFAGGAERLWRDDGIYDVIVVIGHNDDPPAPGAGSAIFLHVAREGFGATEGCVALARETLIGLVEKLAPGDTIAIAAPEAAAR